MVKRIVNFPDGATRQYRNKNNFIILAYHKRDFVIDACFELFTATHSKSPCNGIGGTLEREDGELVFNGLIENKF